MWTIGRAWASTRMLMEELRWWRRKRLTSLTLMETGRREKDKRK